MNINKYTFVKLHIKGVKRLIEGQNGQKNSD